MKITVIKNPFLFLVDSNTHASEKILRRDFWSRFKDTYHFLRGTENEKWINGKEKKLDIRFGLLDYLNPIARATSIVVSFCNEILKENRLIIGSLAMLLLIMVFPFYVVSNGANMLLAGLSTATSFLFIGLTHLITRPFAKNELNEILNIPVDSGVLDDIKASMRWLVLRKDPKQVVDILVKDATKMIHTPIHGADEIKPEKHLGDEFSLSTIEDMVVQPDYESNGNLISFKLYMRNCQIYGDVSDGADIYESKTKKPLATITYKKENYSVIKALVTLNMFHAAEKLEEKEGLLEKVKQDVGLTPSF